MTHKQPFTLRCVKSPTRCKGCRKPLTTEKKGGEKVITFYSGGSNGSYVHICGDCVFMMLDTLAEDATPVVEGSVHDAS